MIGVLIQSLQVKSVFPIGDDIAKYHVHRGVLKIKLYTLHDIYKELSQPKKYDKYTFGKQIKPCLQVGNKY